MGTPTIVAVTAAKLISFGFCLSIGFWAGRKLTNLADEYLLKWDEYRMNKLAEEVKEVIG
jgi:hypothetical protein